MFIAADVLYTFLLPSQCNTQHGICCHKASGCVVCMCLNVCQFGPRTVTLNCEPTTRLSFFITRQEFNVLLPQNITGNSICSSRTTLFYCRSVHQDRMWLSFQLSCVCSLHTKKRVERSTPGQTTGTRDTLSILLPLTGRILSTRYQFYPLPATHVYCHNLVQFFITDTCRRNVIAILCTLLPKVFSLLPYCNK